jgi:hypothetical protein
MHDAGLHDHLREDGVDRIGKTLQAVDDGDENWRRRPGSFMTKANLAPSKVSIRRPAFAPSGVTPSAKYTANEPFVTYFDTQGSK